MADQMTPAELRAHADRIADRYTIQDGDAALWRSMVHVVQAARDLADVLDLADDVTSYRAGHVGTHYEDCYRHHAGCLAARIRAAADPRVEARDPATNPECNRNKTKEER